MSEACLGSRKSARLIRIEEVIVAFHCLQTRWAVVMSLSGSVTRIASSSSATLKTFSAVVTFVAAL